MKVNLLRLTYVSSLWKKFAPPSNDLSTWRHLCPFLPLRLFVGLGFPQSLQMNRCFFLSFKVEFLSKHAEFSAKPRAKWPTFFVSNRTDLRRVQSRRSFTNEKDKDSTIERAQIVAENDPEPNFALKWFVSIRFSRCFYGHWSITTQRISPSPLPISISSNQTHKDSSSVFPSNRNCRLNDLFVSRSWPTKVNRKFHVTKEEPNVVESKGTIGERRFTQSFDQSEELLRVENEENFFGSDRWESTRPPTKRREMRQKIGSSTQRTFHLNSFFTSTNDESRTSIVNRINFERNRILQWTSSHSIFALNENKRFMFFCANGDVENFWFWIELEAKNEGNVRRTSPSEDRADSIWQKAKKKVDRIDSSCAAFALELSRWKAWRKRQLDRREFSGFQLHQIRSSSQSSNFQLLETFKGQIVNLWQIVDRRSFTFVQLRFFFIRNKKLVKQKFLLHACKTSRNSKRIRIGLRRKNESRSTHSHTVRFCGGFVTLQRSFKVSQLC